jgi:hypothetical protein
VSKSYAVGRKLVNEIVNDEVFDQRKSKETLQTNATSICGLQCWVMGGHREA